MNQKLEVKESKTHGKGVFAKEHIQAKERLAIFGGSVMYIAEYDNLPEAAQPYVMQIEERFIFGNKTHIQEKTDYFNHSCYPNSGFQGQIFLVAMQDITKGEEITFDYAMMVSESVGSDIVFELDCNCGSPHCRKKLTEQDWKLPSLRAKYKDYFSEYIKQKILSEK
jgi:SET domain-containing protein